MFCLERGKLNRYNACERWVRHGFVYLDEGVFGVTVSIDKSND